MGDRDSEEIYIDSSHRDYGLSFGSFPKDATMGAELDSMEVVNEGIDSPLGVVPDEARPMWNWILCDENYLNEYHETISEVAEIIESESNIKDMGSKEVLNR